MGHNSSQRNLTSPQRNTRSHVTLSTKMLQANGEAEGAVQTIKNALMKEKDPAKALILQSNSTGKRVLPC